MSDLISREDKCPNCGSNGFYHITFSEGDRIYKKCMKCKNKWIDDIATVLIPISVIEQIKAEIKNYCCFTTGTENDPAITLHDVFEIIDRYIKEYKTESEDKL